MKNKKLRIVNKFRFTTFVIVTCLFIMVLINSLFKSNTAYSDIENRYIEFEVMTGDTMWEIAKNNNPNNYDIRKVVYEIMEVNRMDSANIKPGDIIKLPSYSIDRVEGSR